MNVATLTQAIVDRQHYSRDLSRSRLHTSDTNMRAGIRLADGRVAVMRSITHVRKPESDKWMVMPDTKSEVNSCNNLNRIQERQNLMIYDNLERQEANIFKVSQKRDMMRDMSLFVSREQRVLDQKCKQSHNRIIEKLKHRDKLRDELKTTNLKFYKLATEIENLKVIMGNIGGQYEKNYALLHNEPSKI